MPDISTASGLLIFCVNLAICLASLFIFCFALSRFTNKLISAKRDTKLLVWNSSTSLLLKAKNSDLAVASTKIRNIKGLLLRKVLSVALWTALIALGLKSLFYIAMGWSLGSSNSFLLSAVFPMLTSLLVCGFYQRGVLRALDEDVNIPLAASGDSRSTTFGGLDKLNKEILDEQAHSLDAAEQLATADLKEKYSELWIVLCWRHDAESNPDLESELAQLETKPLRLQADAAIASFLKVQKDINTVERIIRERRSTVKSQRQDNGKPREPRLLSVGNQYVFIDGRERKVFDFCKNGAGFSVVQHSDDKSMFSTGTKAKLTLQGDNSKTIRCEIAYVGSYPRWPWLSNKPVMVSAFTVANNPHTPKARMLISTFQYMNTDITL